MNDTILQYELKKYAERLFGDAANITVLDSHALKGGHVSDRVERLRIKVVLIDNNERYIDVVRKKTWYNEVHAMTALRSVPEDATALPELICHGTDEYGEWLFMPFYDGVQPGKADIPDEVFESLAYVHARYLGRVSELDRIVTVDSVFWRRTCLDVALQAVEERILTSPAPVLFRARRELAALAEDRRIHAALALLPQTLLHGDMHNGNILSGSAGVKIIDWGNARIGPAMLDLANITGQDSPQFVHYAQAWERITGNPINRKLSTIGYLWATVQVNVQYLGFAVKHLTSEDVEAMLDKARNALHDLGEALI